MGFGLIITIDDRRLQQRNYTSWNSGYWPSRRPNLLTRCISTLPFARWSSKMVKGYGLNNREQVYRETSIRRRSSRKQDTV
jgi:hypothetical protein